MSNVLNYECIKSHSENKWIVLIHGAGGSIATWSYQLEALKANFNLLLIDLRDHGKSKNLQPAYDSYNFEIVSEDIFKVLDTEKIHNAHFITLSFGSVIMQSIYKRRPAVVDQIVFIGGIFNANYAIKVFVHLARFLNLFLSYPAMYKMFSFLLMPKKEHQLARRVYQRQASKIGSKEYLKWLGLYGEFFQLLASFHQQKIRHKMLVLMGEDDYMFLASARKFISGKKNVKLKLISGAGHVCNIDQPKATNKELLNFLKDHRD